jgi:serine/threonine-protein kinase
MAWRAEDRLLRRTVTVKLIHPSLGDDPAFAERLGDEVRRIASLAAPGVAGLLDSGEEDGITYLVREHVEGESARAILDRSGPLAPEEATRIAIAVLDALAPAHDAGILHLHLDLDDVLLTPDGRVRVTDLGIGPAVTTTRSAAEAARLLGGDALAPEQATTSTLDVRTDVYAVGVLLFELLTGAPPRGRRSPRDLVPSLPRELDRAVARALAPEAQDRFSGVAPFAAALRAGPSAETVVDVTRRRWVGAWLVVPIAIALVAAGVIALGLWLGRLEVGGPLGIRPAADPTSLASPAAPVTTTAAASPASVLVLDPPPGDGTENDSTAPNAIDGDPATAWRSENYFDGRLNKDGVGLVFDLGTRSDVVGFVLSTPHPGFVFHVAVGDDPDGMLDQIGGPLTADEETRAALEGTGRYVLVWITTVVPVTDGNRAEISEFLVVTETDA